MDQQLVINIYKTKTDLEHYNAFACIYFHWSNYTTTATLTTWSLMHDFPKNQKLSDAELTKYFVHKVKEEIGEIVFNNVNYYGETKNPHRNDGFIAVSNKYDREFHDWSKGEVHICLEDFTFKNDVVLKIFDLKDYCDEFELDYEHTKAYIEKVAIKFDINKYHPIDDALDIAVNLEDVEFIVTSDNVLYQCIGE